VKPLRIGTRGSALALWQANYIKDKLAELHGVAAELVRIRTTGDHFQTASVAQIGAELGGKGVFIKELEDALLAGTVDVAVHSMKDVPTETPRGLTFPAITRREDPRDGLISREGRKLAELPRGARIGTSSLRRQAQLRHYRGDLEVVELRGNVDTRLRKLAADEFEAIVLAVAGVTRLGAHDRVTEVLPPEVMLPAVGQGALGIETRENDREISALVAALDDAETRACVEAERALLRELEGGCQVPLGAWARLEGGEAENDLSAKLGGEIHIDACLLSPDGSEFLRDSQRGSAADPSRLGQRLGQALKEAGGERILRLAGRPVGSR
jgi:hydroxymethylbilane synthase